VKGRSSLVHKPAVFSVAQKGQGPGSKAISLLSTCIFVHQGDGCLLTFQAAPGNYKKRRKQVTKNLKCNKV